MMLDERTIMVTMAVMQLLMALMAAAVRRGHREFAAGMGSWAVGVLLISAGLLLSVLAAGAIDTVRLLLSNSCYSSGISFLGFGMARFLGQSPRPRSWVAATLAVYLGGAAFSLDAQGQMPARVSLFMLQQLVVAVLILQAVLTAREPRGSVGAVLLLSTALLLLLAALTRGSAALTGWAPVGLLAGTSWIWLVVGVIGLALVVGTLGMILLAGERTRHRLEQLASHDGLTGLLTRGGFAELAEHVLAASRRETRLVGFLIIDIDHFKAINDGHGHQAGDAVLATVAQRLRDAAREIDLVSRFGGEEFAVLLPQADLEQARQAAERLRRCIADTAVPCGMLALPVSISIGVSSGDATEIDIDRLYREADAALYRAKAGGRNRVECAEGDATAATMPG